MITDIKTKLDELFEIRAALDVARLDYQNKRDEILAQVKNQLDALEVEYAPNMAIASERATQLDSDIRAAVIANGASVKAAHLHAVYTGGRVTWDTKKLDGLALAFPQLAEARKVGEPSVTIRALK